MTVERRSQVEILPDLAWDEFLRRFRHAEALGFDLATTADQFVDWKDPTVPWFDVWSALAAVAQATDRIRLAPCVAQIPMRRSPDHGRLPLAPPQWRWMRATHQDPAGS